MNKKNLFNMVLLALFMALVLIFALTPLGYLPIGPIAITFMCIPVILGAILLGPAYGAVLGAAFGIVMFTKAPTDPLFSGLLTTHMLELAVVCIVPRTLVGLISGLLAGAVRGKKAGYPFYSIVGLVGSLTNTVLFIGSMLLILYNPVLEIMQGANALGGKTLIGFWVSTALANGLPEAFVTTIIIGGVAKPLISFARSRNYIK